MYDLLTLFMHAVYISANATNASHFVGLLDLIFLPYSLNCWKKECMFCTICIVCKILMILSVIIVVQICNNNDGNRNKEFLQE